MRRWRVDGLALQRLAALVGLRNPVVVTLVGYKREYGGRYVAFRDAGRFGGHLRGQHRIALDRHLFRREALRVLLHELGHALQVENIGDHKEMERQWFAEMAAAGVTRGQLATGRGVDWDAYVNTPLEVDAEAVATRWVDDPRALELNVIADVVVQRHKVTQK